VDWAELVTLDLSLFDQSGGKEKLAEQLHDAAKHVGFFYVKNFGISQEEVDGQFALGREFYNLPLDEKLKYHNLEDLQSGEYNGYRPAGLRAYVFQNTMSQQLLTLVCRLTDTIRDNVQVYNIPKFDGYHKRAQPSVLQEHIDEIADFSRKCH
jgi:isopenicillin N synthase-like dioxygenase